VRAFLAPAAHLPVVADLALCESPHVSGLACVLLGCCLSCGDSDETDADADAARGVLDVIVARVGLDAFFARWEEMRRSPEFAAAEAGPALAPNLTRVTAQRLALGGSGDKSASPHSYDADVARFVVAFEQQVKERVISLYARPRGGVAGGGDAAARAAREAALDARPGESAQAHAARLKGSLRSAESELEAQRARNAVLAERLMSLPHEARSGEDGAAAGGGGGAGDPGRGSNAPGGNDPGAASAHSGGASTSSAEVRASLDRAAAAAEEELRVTKAELEEARMMVASSNENLRGLSEAYNGLELEVSRRDDELEALRARLESAGADAASAPAAAGNPAPDPAALAAAREEGRREAISEMAHRLEETEEAAAADVAAARERGAREAEAAAAAAAEAEAEMSDLLACLGQEESKTEALMARLIEKHGEKEADLEALLAECAEEEADE
jgi:hypothetical protein